MTDTNFTYETISFVCELDNYRLIHTIQYLKTGNLRITKPLGQRCNTIPNHEMRGVHCMI